MICGKTVKGKINNENIPEMTGVERLEFFKRTKVAMLGHVEKIDEERDPVRALYLEVSGQEKSRKTLR